MAKHKDVKVKKGRRLAHGYETVKGKKNKTYKKGGFLTKGKKNRFIFKTFGV